MSYQDELQAKLDATRSAVKEENSIKYDASKVDELIVQELHDEFDLSQYDLQEGDVLRAIKIESLLSEYHSVFNFPYSLKVFYSIAKATSLNINSLFRLIHLPKNDFLHIIKEMRYVELIETNEHNEVSLTAEGKDFAKNIGIDIFI